MSEEITLISPESDEQVQDFIRIYTTTPGILMPPDEEIPQYVHYYMIAVSMHRLKLADVVWFDAERFPIHPDEETEVLVNLDANQKETSRKTMAMQGMTLSGLVGLTNKLAKPEWAKKLDESSQH